MPQGRWDAAEQACLSATVASGKLGTRRPPLDTSPAGLEDHTVALIRNAGMGLAARTAAEAGISAWLMYEFPV